MIRRSPLPLFFIILIYLPLSDSGTVYDSSYVFIRGRNVKSGESVEVCGNYQQWKDREIRGKDGELPWHKIGWWKEQENYDLCATPIGNVTGKVVPSWYREVQACPSLEVSAQFTHQVEMVQSASASAAVFLVNYGEEYVQLKYTNQSVQDLLFADFFDGFLNDSVAKIPVFFMYTDIWENEILGLSEKKDGKDVEIQFYRPNEMEFDFAMLIIFLLAVACVTIGGIWSGRIRHKLWIEENETIEKRERGEGEGHETGPDPEAAEERSPLRKPAEESAQNWNCISIIFFIVIIVGMLLLLYYFFFIFVWFILVTYTLASCFAMFTCLSALLDRCCKCAECRVPCSLAEGIEGVAGRRPPARLSCQCCEKTPKWRDLLLFAACATFAISWCIMRKWGYAFILQDTLSFFFCINLLRQLRVSNLKWLAILLVCLLVYDLFMVFVTPLLTKDGCSIMVEVATGGGCQHGEETGIATAFPPRTREQLPIVFQVPRLRDPMIACYNMTIDLQFPPMILGLGDVILPGLLVSFCFAMDFILQTKMVYGTVCVLAYGAGMILTFVALMFMKQAQPALIYLVPSTLLATILTSLIRREFMMLWTGIGLPIERPLKDRPPMDDGGAINSS